MKLEIYQKNSLENSTQYAYRILKENILNLNLKPGQPINESEVCLALELSRSPVRSALAQLKNENLVNVFPQKGTFVTHFNEESIREGWFVREVLETKILQDIVLTIDEAEIQELEKILNFQKVILEYEYSPLEAFNSDNEFHGYLFEIGKKKNVWNNLLMHCTQLNRLRLLDAIRGSHKQDVIREHEIIVAALKERKRSKIEKIVKKHLSDYDRQIKEAIKRYPHYFSEE